MNIPVIMTSDLILRAFTVEDIDPLYCILRQPDVLRYFPKTTPVSYGKVEKMVVAVLNHWTEHGYGLWAVTSRLNGVLMGRGGLQYLPETQEVEIDFLLGQEFWGQGFATQIGQASLRYGCEELGLENIVGIVHQENKASQRVLEKIGMRFVEQAQYFGMDCYRYIVECKPGNMVA